MIKHFCDWCGKENNSPDYNWKRVRYEREGLCGHKMAIEIMTYKDSTSNALELCEACMKKMLLEASNQAVLAQSK